MHPLRRKGSRRPSRSMCPMYRPPPQGDHAHMLDSSVIAFRTATADDDQVLRDLSALDSHEPLQRPAVLAIVDGAPVAAVSLSDGQIVADPFTRTEDVVVLLRARVAALAAQRASHRGLARLGRLRFAA